MYCNVPWLCCKLQNFVLVDYYFSAVTVLAGCPVVIAVDLQCVSVVGQCPQGASVCCPANWMFFVLHSSWVCTAVMVAGPLRWWRLPLPEWYLLYCLWLGFQNAWVWFGLQQRCPLSFKLSFSRLGLRTKFGFVYTTINDFSDLIYALTYVKIHVTIKVYFFMFFWKQWMCRSTRASELPRQLVKYTQVSRGAEAVVCQLLQCFTQTANCGARC